MRGLTSQAAPLVSVGASDQPGAHGHPGHPGAFAPALALSTRPPGPPRSLTALLSLVSSELLSGSQVIGAPASQPSVSTMPSPLRPASSPCTQGHALHRPRNASRRSRSLTPSTKAGESGHRNTPSPQSVWGPRAPRGSDALLCRKLGLTRGAGGRVGWGDWEGLTGNSRRREGLWRSWCSQGGRSSRLRPGSPWHRPFRPPGHSRPRVPVPPAGPSHRGRHS